MIERIKVGDKVVRKSAVLGCGVGEDGKFSLKRNKPISCTVVYVHPKGRFHIVEFEVGKNKIKESFWGSWVYKTDRKRASRA